MKLRLALLILLVLLVNLGAIPAVLWLLKGGL